MSSPVAFSQKQPWLSRRACLLAAAAGMAAPWVRAQSGRHITFIVPQPAGNPSDVFARKLQTVMQRELGQTIVIENLPGAGGSIGVQRMLNAPAAGKPLTFGHIGQGSMIHLMGTQWARLCGVPLVHVPYRGVPPVVQDLMGNQIDLSFVPLGGAALNMLETGKLRAFGSTAAKAPSLLPHVAPLSQQSAALKGFEYTAWGALLVARSTPDAAVHRLHQAFGVALRDTEVQSFLRANGTEPQEPLSLAALDHFYQSEIQIHQALARTVGVVPE